MPSFKTPVCSFIDEEHQHDAPGSYDPSTPTEEPGADVNTASFVGVQYVGRTNTFLRDDSANHVCLPLVFLHQETCCTMKDRLFIISIEGLEEKHNWPWY